jgi:DNA-binding PadR family transcriptional regulator
MLREPTYYILASLLDGPLHGYAVIKAAAELSDGRVRLTAGTLYGALDRLAEEGLIASSGEETVNGRARRYYRITPAGSTALMEEAAAHASAAAAVKGRLGSASRAVRPA